MESYFVIDFQDFFENDLGSFKFNECTIFEDICLNSNQSTGLTSIRIKIYKKANNKYQITYFGSSTECRTLQNKIEITVILNGAANKYLIDINAGSFIGFSKKNKAELYFNQSQIPFEYN
jgi:hypothetical protein